MSEKRGIEERPGFPGALPSAGGVGAISGPPRPSVRLDVFSDYLWPWCYNAAVRLTDVQQAYGPRVHVEWRAFPLLADSRAGRRSTAETRASRERAASDEPRAGFVLPEPGTALPASSIPALTAAKAAERQGPEAFAAFHQALFAALFHDNLDIGRADVVWRVAQQSGLDMARFEHDCASGEPHQAVLHDYAEAVAWFGVSALPTVVFNEKVSLVGAVPVEQYRLLIDWMLAGEPGGLIPLAGSTPAAGAAGQSPVARAAGSREVPHGG